MTESVYKQTITEVVRVIRDLGLGGIESTEVQERKFPWDDTHAPVKGITVSWDTEKESGGTTCRDDYGYPCVVTMVNGTGKGWREGTDRITEWRQLIRKAFHNKRLSNVYSTGANHLICKVLHKDIELPDKYKGNFDVGQLVIICWFRESR